MANRKVVDLPELTTMSNDDELYIVDKSDLTESSEGTSKKIKASNFVPAGGELIANKQNSLTTDGTGVKYPTVDAVRSEALLLSGTELGNPVSGDIEINANTLIGDGYLIRASGASFNIGDFIGNIMFPSDGENLNAVINYPSTTKGLSGQENYSPNITDLDYPQKIYVDSGLASKADKQGTILYHSVKWFTPSSSVSNVGATVTSIGTQFTSAMVGAILRINDEDRLIITYTSTTVVVVDFAYSTNYSGVVAGSWGVYSKAYTCVSGIQDFYSTTGESKINISSAGITTIIGVTGSSSSFEVRNGNANGSMLIGADVNAITKTNNVRKIGRFVLPSYADITKNHTILAADAANAADSVLYFGGIPAGTPLGVTEINFCTVTTNGNAGGNIAMQIVRSGNVLINKIIDNGIDKLQVNGTISMSPATLSNQGVIKSQLSTQYEVGANSNVLDVWMDNEVIFTASCTITVPATLPTNFNFNWLTLAGVTVTWAITSPHTWLFGTPGNATEKTYGRMVKRNSTNSIIML